MMGWHTTRKSQYTKAGIQRCKCIRCGAPASFQWQICADNNNYRPLCRSCDVELNRAVLEFMRHPDATRVADMYMAKKFAEWMAENKAAIPTNGSKNMAGSESEPRSYK